VACELYIGPADAVFFDPLLPADTHGFWQWADEQVGGRRVHVLTTVAPHRRSRREVVARYGAGTSRARSNLPAEIVPIVLRGARETEFWIPEHRTLIIGDRILADDDGRLRLCPDSWLRRLRPPLRRRELGQILRQLLHLPVQRVLVSHGKPVLNGGDRALRELLA
jgi:hypothetical protein